MKDLVKAFKNLPWIVKLLLVIVYNIYGGLTRIFRSFAKKKKKYFRYRIINFIICFWMDCIPNFRS